jgi:hypothetical protein
MGDEFFGCRGMDCAGCIEVGFPGPRQATSWSLALISSCQEKSASDRDHPNPTEASKDFWTGSHKPTASVEHTRGSRTCLPSGILRGVRHGGRIRRRSWLLGLGSSADNDNIVVEGITILSTSLKLTSYSLDRPV